MKGRKKGGRVTSSVRLGIWRPPTDNIPWISLRKVDRFVSCPTTPNVVPRQGKQQKAW